MIDAKLQAKLREKFNPDGSELRNLQLRMLEMLKYIDKICQDNDITYWLSSGTCLGAVRHGGFIPWDDDVDIEMLEPDYKKLCSILRNKTDSPYVLQDYNSDKEYVQPFAKLREKGSVVQEDNDFYKWAKYQGIYIDIFCIGPSSSKFVWKVCASLWGRSIWKCPGIKNRWLRRGILALFYFVYKQLLFPPIIYITKLKKYGIYRHCLGVRFPKERFEEDVKEIKYINFEDTILPIPMGYDHYLTHLYGDYMNIPDTEQLHSHFINYKINVNEAKN